MVVIAHLSGLDGELSSPQSGHVLPRPRGELIRREHEVDDHVRRNALARQRDVHLGAIGNDQPDAALASQGHAHAQREAAISAGARFVARTAPPLGIAGAPARQATVASVGITPVAVGTLRAPVWRTVLAVLAVLAIAAHLAAHLAAKRTVRAEAGL